MFLIQAGGFVRPGTAVSGVCRPALLYNPPQMSKTSRLLIRQGWDALEAEEIEEAEVLGRRALLSEPDSVEARLLVGRSLLESEDYRGAAGFLRESVEASPDDAEARTWLGISLFETCSFDEAREHLSRAVELDEHYPDAHFWLGMSLERSGAYEEAERHFHRSSELDPDNYSRPTRISRQECHEAIDRAVQRLPDEFRDAMENVSISLEDLPQEGLLRDCEPPMDPCLLGLFVGVPLSERSVFDLPKLPDLIHIYQRNIERESRDHVELEDEIFTTLYHEVGHYLGYDDEDLDRLGYA